MLNLITPEDKVKIINKYSEIVKTYNVTIRLSPELEFCIKSKYKAKATGEEIKYSLTDCNALDFVLTSFDMMFSAKTNYLVYKPEYLVALAFVTELLEPNSSMSLILEQLINQQIEHIPVIEWSVTDSNNCVLATQDPKLFIGSSFKLINPACSIVNYNQTTILSPFDPLSLLRLKTSVERRPWIFKPAKRSKNHYSDGIDLSDTTSPFDIVLDENKLTGVCSFDGRSVDPVMRFAFFSTLADVKFMVPILEGLKGGNTLIQNHFDFCSSVVKIKTPALITQPLECEDFMFFKYGNPKYSFIGTDR